MSLLSDIGKTRTENQDRCGDFLERGSERLVIVADGMGGHRGGATAAQMAVDRFGIALSDAGSEQGDKLLSRAVDRANEDIYQSATSDPELNGMGTTVVAVFFSDAGNWLMHVGDSRAYRLREGRLVQMTDDHSTVMELVRTGRIRPDEAATHPRKNEVLRSLGLPDPVEPEVQPLDARPGDRFLLCSDGLSGVVSDEEIADFLQRFDGERATQALVDAANAAGGPDNVTVALVEVPSIQAEDPATEKVASPAASRPNRNQRLNRLVGVAVVTAILLVLMLALFVTSSLMSQSSDSGSPQPSTTDPAKNALPLPSDDSDDPEDRAR